MATGVVVSAAAGWFAYTATAAGPSAPSITASPANLTNQTSASFTYTDSGTVARFECQLDGSGFSTCGTTKPSTKAYTALAAGSHTFQVRAVATTGSNAGTSAATSYTWVIDRTPPTVGSISRVDPSPTNVSQVHWSVTFSKPVTGVSSSAFSLATSGLSGSIGITGVSGGPTVYTVSASDGSSTPSGSGTIQLNIPASATIKDLAGNALAGAPVSGQQYVVDKTAPKAESINRADPSPTHAASVHWTVVFSEPVTGVAASKFGLSASGLSGSVSITGVAGSGNTYTVTASTGSGTPFGTGSLQLRLMTAGAVKDAVGNTLTGLPFSGQTYSIDKTPPPPPLIYGEPPAYSSSTSATFRFADDSDNDGDSGIGDDDDLAGATFLCSRDGAAFMPCSSSVLYTSLPQGSNTFKVQAVDLAGNASGVSSYTWVIDTVAPTVAFDQTPPNPDTSTSPQFKFHASDPGGSGVALIQCKLDTGAWQTCTSPRTMNGLALSTHTFSIRATDNAGNISAAVAYMWKIQTGATPYTITGGTFPASTVLYPTSAPTGAPINVTFSNPNTAAVQVTSIHVAIASITAPHATSNLPCNAADFAVTDFSGSPFQIPSGASSLNSLSIAQSTWPTVRWVNTTTNQDGCIGATVNLSYTGTS